MRRKGVYPYGYMDGWKKFEETSLPPKDAFYSRLNMKDISDQDYEHAQQVWNIMDRCGPRVLGRCSIKQVGHHGWPAKKILSSRLSETCLNLILYILFSIGTGILIVYCAL